MKESSKYVSDIWKNIGLSLKETFGSTIGGLIQGLGGILLAELALAANVVFQTLQYLGGQFRSLIDLAPSASAK